MWVALMASGVSLKLGGAGLQPRETDGRISEYPQVRDGGGLAWSVLSWDRVVCVPPGSA